MKKSTLLILIASFFLQSCIDPVTGCVSGAQMTYNRYNLKKSLDDQILTMKANNAVIVHTQEFKNENLSISVFNRIALMTGQVSTQQLKTEAEKIIKNIEGIQKVYNLAEVSPPTSALTRVSDAWITTKIKTQLIASNDLDPTQIKVITENGTVYLLGIVPPEQADNAVLIARSTTGVQHVVKIFSYLLVSNKVSV